MGDTIITWNWVNWITVGLMAATFAAIVGCGLKIWNDTTAAANAPA